MLLLPPQKKKKILQLLAYSDVMNEKGGAAGVWTIVTASCMSRHQSILETEPVKLWFYLLYLMLR